MHGNREFVLPIVLPIHIRDIEGHFTLVMHKISAQNRFAASIAASKALYSFFLDLT